MPNGTQAVLSEGKEAAGLQHSVGLAEKAAAVGDVHSHMLRIGAIELAVRIGQMLSIALPDRHPILQADERGKLVTRHDKGRRDVETAHPAVEALGEVTRRTAEASANVD